MQSPRPPESSPYPQSSETVPEAYTCMYIDPEEHEELLRAITLKPEDVTQEWMVELDKLIAKDNQLQDRGRRPFDKEQTRGVRLQFERKLGLLHPDNPLNLRYLQARRNRPLLPVPESIMNSLFALVRIGGSVDKGISLVRGISNSLSGTGKSFPVSARHIRYLAGVLGWRGEPFRIIEEVPGLFGASVARRSLLARLAMEHGRSPQQGFNIKAIQQVFANHPPEAHLMALLARGKHYTFGQVVPEYRKAGPDGLRPPWTTEERRTWIFNRLQNPENIQLLGHNILRAFLTYVPLTERLYEQFPYLAEYVPRGKKPTPPKPRLSRHDFNKQASQKYRPGPARP